MTTPTHFAAIPSELGQAASLAPVGPLVSPRWRGVNFPHQIVGLLIPLSTRKSAQARYLVRTTFPAPHASTLLVDEIDSMLAVGACASFGGREEFKRA
jgi:hypothetical protein